MRRFLSYYHFKLPVFLAYMLQQVEYNPNKFLRWILRYPDLSTVMRRQTLVKTVKARLLIGFIGMFFAFYILLAVWYFLFSPALGFLTLLVTPWLVILLTYLTVLLAWLNFEEPRRSRVIRQASKTFRSHKGIKIAIAGSYGKTSMKELLNAVLSEGKRVAATPGNKNVTISHAAWARSLNGDEEILLIEYGEGAPGDIKKMAELSHPDYGIITGLAPNHLDEYKHLSAIADDLLSLGKYVDPKKLFVNEEAFKREQIPGMSTYSENAALGWKIQKVEVDYDGTSFTMRKNSQTIKVKSSLLGRHQVGPLALAAALADKFGLTKQQIEAGLAKTRPFEHRMQPRQLGSAWVIDDAYNGSLEGFRAGLELLKELPAKRKIYVTPGLVDQGEETERVHTEIGGLIAKASPDHAVLMQNSVTEHIVRGLYEGGYQAELHVETDPLNFYENLEHIVASGDLVMLQNDWTDNYR